MNRICYDTYKHSSYFNRASFTSDTALNEVNCPEIAQDVDLQYEEKLVDRIIQSILKNPCLGVNAQCNRYGSVQSNGYYYKRDGKDEVYLPKGGKKGGKPGKVIKRRESKVVQKARSMRENDECEDDVDVDMYGSLLEEQKETILGDVFD